MLTKGIWPLKWRWHSICSKHRDYDATCRLCQQGAWHNVVMLWLSQTLFRVSPAAWRFLQTLKS